MYVDVYKTEALMPYGRIDKFSSLDEAVEFANEQKRVSGVDFIVVMERISYSTADHEPRTLTVKEYRESLK